jgi:hypothetical protein
MAAKTIFLVCILAMLAGPAQAGEAGDLYTKAKKFLQAGDEEFAFMIFRKLVREYPESKWACEAHFRVAEFYFLQNYKRKAGIELQRHLELYPRSPYRTDAKIYLKKIEARNLAYRGDDFYRKDEWSQALSVYNEALKLDSGLESSLQENIAVCEKKLGMTDKESAEEKPEELQREIVARQEAPAEKGEAEDKPPSRVLTKSESSPKKVIWPYYEAEEPQPQETGIKDAKFELSAGTIFTKGEQGFKVIDLQGKKISELKYPFGGQLFMASAEVRPHPKFSIGGRYATSHFRHTTSSDEDWDINPLVSYQITRQNTECEMQFWDANLYYRLLDLDRDKLNEEVAKHLVLDRLYLDILGGYQWHESSYTMIDPLLSYIFQLIDGSWWQFTGLPADVGLEASYAVEYQGPRLGLRLGGSKGDKFSSRLSVSYAWIDTDATGWWNLRRYHFWQQGSDGYALNVDVEGIYHPTPDWFISAGFFYALHEERKLTESGVQPGFKYKDWDIIRDVRNTTYGPFIKIGYRW